MPIIVVVVTAGSIQSVGSILRGDSIPAVAVGSILVGSITAVGSNFAVGSIPAVDSSQLAG